MKEVKLSDLLNSNISWFKRSEKTVKEIKDWLEEIYSYECFQNSPAAPIVLLALLCEKCGTGEKNAKIYMETAALSLFAQDRNDVFEAIENNEQALKEDGLNQIAVFLETYRGIRSETASVTQTAADNKKIENGADAAVSEDEALINRNSFIKGAAAGLLAGVVLTAGVFAMTGSGNQKKTEPAPIVTEAQTKAPEETKAPVTEAQTEAESESETETAVIESSGAEETTSRASRMKIYCSAGTIKIRGGAGKNYAPIALADGMAGLVVSVGQEYADENGEDIMWTEIFPVKYLDGSNEHFTIFDPADTDVRYFIASQYLQNIEE